MSQCIPCPTSVLARAGLVQYCSHWEKTWNWLHAIQITGWGKEWGSKREWVWDWLASHLKKRCNKNSLDSFLWPGSFSLSFTHWPHKGTSVRFYPLTWSEGGKPQRSFKPFLKLCMCCQQPLPKPFLGLCLNFLFLPGDWREKFSSNM